MDVVSGRMGSALNPEAAPYVPGAYLAVRAFSAEWRELVRSFPWLRECFHEPQDDRPRLRECFYKPQDAFDIYDPALPADDVSLSYPPHQEVEKKEEKRRNDKIKWEMMTWGAEKWKARRGFGGEAKYAEKAPRIVNVKVSPRTIQQPR